MRKVIAKVFDTETKKYVEKEGLFHQFSLNFMEFESGPGQFAVAIVELIDGTVVTPDATFIRFVDSIQEVASQESAESPRYIPV